MDIPEYILNSKNSLVVCPEEEFQLVQESIKKPSIPIKTQKHLVDISPESIESVFVYYPKKALTNNLVSELVNISKPGSKLFIQSDPAELEFLLKVNGFVNLDKENVYITCEKPTYQLGSTAKISNKNVASVWKIDDDNEDELIDSDELLDEHDLERPSPNTLKVCGTTGKRKACKDCSCGLAEELASEVKPGNVVDTTALPKSSCGSVSIQFKTFYFQHS